MARGNHAGGAERAGLTSLSLSAPSSLSVPYRPLFVHCAGGVLRHAVRSVELRS